MLAVDLRFPKPKPLRRYFIELIWKGGVGSGREKAEEGKGGRRGGAGEEGLRGGE
jgi:hypothetical protein